MLEVDYPHGDSTWPDTQRVIEEHWGHIPDDELRLMTHANAAALFRQPAARGHPPLTPAASAVDRQRGGTVRSRIAVSA